MNRRRLLSALGAGAALTGVSTMSADTQTLEFQHVCGGNSDSIKYQFAIDGEIVDPSPDDEDEIVDSGEGGIGYVAQGGIDTWAYSGTLQEVRANAPVELRVNGNEIVQADCDAEGPVVHKQLGQASTTGAQSTTSGSGESANTAEAAEVDSSDGFCRFDNGINIRSQPNEVEFELATTHGIETNTGRRVDTISTDHRAEYTYAGEIFSFRLQGRGRVYIDQTTVCGEEAVSDKDNVAGGGHDEFCEFNQSVSAYAPRDESAAVTFGASHEIQVSEGGRRVPALTFEIDDDSSKIFNYAGWLTAFALDGVAEVRIEQPAPCANPSE